MGSARHKPDRARPRSTLAIGAKRTILLAEDNADNRTVLGMILEMFGFEVVAVTDGLEAFEACQRRKFDLALLDFHMPNLDGLSAVSNIRGWESKSGAERLPIAVLSADVTSDRRTLARDLGVDRYIAKPITPEALKSEIIHTLQAAGCALAPDWPISA